MDFQDPDKAPLICGIGLRLPGAQSLADAWDVLAKGRSTVGQVSSRGFDPAFYHDPKPGRRGKAYTLAAGQIDGLYDFDPGFFGISPREAAEMDPQQRLMLMVAWEAVEDAGLDIARLRGPRTGVFIGSSIVENLSAYYYDTARGGSTFPLGNTLAIIANRVSRRFDFSGPSLVMDTACSSGLTALDTAARALRRGELDAAIVGGVNVVRAPGGFVGFSQARMLSPTGACRAFDAAADGYVRSEAAVALLLLRPGTAAAADARRRARILATGVNTDGGASPLTVPSAAQQEALLDAVFAQTGHDPDEISFYEAHGTGTQVGDLAEATSLGRALGSLRRAPLPIGSAKTNFGHSEPAAGLVGVVKATLAMERRILPASLNFRVPNPSIDFDGLGLAVNAAPASLPEGPLLAGVNAFGFGGTNAVAFLDGGFASRPGRLYPAAGLPEAAAPWLFLTAASEASLARLAEDWAARIAATSPDDWPALAAAAATRAELSHRLAVPLDADAARHLQAFAGGEGGDCLTGRAPFDGARTVLAFPGNGAQVVGMGRAAYAGDSMFRAAFDRMAAAFAAEGVPDLAALLTAPDLAERLRCPTVAQPLLVSCEVAEARSLIGSGLIPDAVVGHSLGELPALAIAGVLDEAGLARVVASRSRALQTLRGTGTMATVALTEAEAERVIAGLGETDLEIAAVNAPRSVTLSGSDAAFNRLARVTVAGRRIAMVRLGLDVPYHSAAVDPLRDRMMDDLSAVHFAPQTLTVAGAAVGRILHAREAGPQYLWRNTRDRVRFADGLAALVAAGPAVVVEIAPQPILGPNIRDLARQDGLPMTHVAATQIRARADRPGEAAARVWTHGASLDRAKLAGPIEGMDQTLPAYPWSLAEYQTRLSADGLDAWGEAGGRAFAGRRPDREAPHWTADITATAPGWLADHRVGAAQVLPAAALVEAALSAARELWPDTVLTLDGFDLIRPAEVAGDGVRLRTVIDPESGRVTLETRSRLVAGDWTRVAKGKVTRAMSAAPPRSSVGRSGTTEDATVVYAALTARGLDYGPAFRRLAAIRKASAGQVRALLRGTPPDGRFALDPTALDAAFHALLPLAEAQARRRDAPPALAEALQDGAALLPTRIGRLVLWRPEAVAAQALLTPGRLRRRSLEIDLLLETAEGDPVAHLERVEFTLVRDVGRSIAPQRWTRRLVRLRGPDQPVATPKGWARPEKALENLGLESDLPPGTGQALLAGLSPAGGALSDPNISALAGILAQAPDMLDEARLILAGGDASGQPDMRRFGATNRARWAVAETIFEDLARRWRKGQRLTLGLIGLPPNALVDRLAVDPRLDGLVLSHPEKAAREALRRGLPRHRTPLVRGGLQTAECDVLLSVSTDCEAFRPGLAPGGLAIEIDGGCDGTPATPHARIAGVAVSVSAGRCPVGTAQTDAAPRLRLLAGSPPDGWADVIDAHATDGLLVSRLGPQDDPEATLAATMTTLRKALSGPDGRLHLLAVDDGADAAFTQLAAGLASVVATCANEMPGREIALVTLAAGACCEPRDALALAGTERVVHLCADSTIRAERLVPLADGIPAAPALALAQALPGHDAAPLWQARARRKPGRGEVEIAVAATGLNFRDAMILRGLLPERLLDGGASGAGLGIEVSGTVLRAGPGARFDPGDRVLSFATEAFASHLTLPDAALLKCPDGLELTTAAALPVAYATARAALLRVARAAPGETLLVHGGAGALGLAATGIARAHGMRVLATASSPERRAIARAAGAEAVFDSRSLAFAEEVREATQGRGVDVVLNSLTGPAMQASLDLLAPFGRFVELGKRGFLDGAALDTSAFARDLGYHGFDLDRRLAQDPNGVAEDLAAVLDAMSTGRLTPMPVTVVPGEELTEAVRQMVAARHVGKIVITPPVAGRRRPRAHTAPTPRDGDWVILGGTGGVGLALARALVAAGASCVHLVSRSGAPAPGAGPFAGWAEASAAVRCHALDAADPTALADLFSMLDAEGRTIRGVVHAAMVLRDRMIADLDPVETAQVLRAKLGVARSLDRVLRDRGDKGTGVIFLSSIAALIGNPGQAAYGAANAAVEALAEARRRDGLHARVIALGPVAGSGVVARHASVAAQLKRIDGLALLPMDRVVAEILSSLDHAAAEEYLYAPVDWPRFAAHLPGLAMPCFGALIPEGAASARLDGALADALRDMTWPKALARLEEELADILIGILRLPSENWDPLRPFGRYGIDSLMAMELRLEIERRLGITLASLPLSEETTPARFAVTLLTRLREGQDD